MPEMPEVETLRRGLERTVQGARIDAIDVLWPAFVQAPRSGLDRVVAGHRIKTIRRRGKALILDLDGAWQLLLHLRMTGQVVVYRRGKLVLFGGHPTANPAGPMPNAWTRAVVSLSAGRTLFLNDHRKFAHLRVVSSADLEIDPFLARMGPEALGRVFTLAAFRQRLAHHRSTPIKAALLDQATVAGIGNIYADECLHLARIHPRRAVTSLAPVELRRLHRAIRVVLRDAVAHDGTSYPHFIHAGRRRLTWLDRARLFGREGQPCPVCGTIVERIRVAGRGTNFCPHCQDPATLVASGGRRKQASARVAATCFGRHTSAPTRTNHRRAPGLPRPQRVETQRHPHEPNATQA